MWHWSERVKSKYYAFIFICLFKAATINKNNHDDENTDDDADLTDNGHEVVLAAIENSDKIRKSSANNNPAALVQGSNYGTPCNPRLKELRRTNTNFSPLAAHNNSSNENNVDSDNNSANQSVDYGNQNKLVLSTPNWMKPKVDGENPFKYNPIIDCDKVNKFGWKLLVFFS